MNATLDSELEKIKESIREIQIAIRAIKER